MQHVPSVGFQDGARELLQDRQRESLQMPLREEAVSDTATKSYSRPNANNLIEVETRLTTSLIVYCNTVYSAIHHNYSLWLVGVSFR